jgi:hypothetical protein
MAEAPFEVPPSGEPIPERGDDYPYPRRKRRRKKTVFLDDVEPKPEQPSPSASPVVTVKELEAVIIASMSLAATLLDESFTVLDKNGKPLPHVEVAAAQMLPWAEIYGAVFVKAFPWCGLIAGLAMLISPAIDPLTEIIAGARKPRIMRKDENDIYTEKYKRAKDRTINVQKVPDREEPTSNVG